LGADLSRETASETPKNTNDQTSKERQMFDQSLDQMKGEFKEHRIDQAERALNKIRDIVKITGISLEDKQYFGLKLTENKLLINDIEDSIRIVKQVLRELEDENVN